MDFDPAARRGTGIVPAPKVVDVQAYADQIRRNETHSCSLKTDHADNDAVHRCQHPALPASPPYQDRRADGQDAR